MKLAKFFVNQDCRTSALLTKVGPYGDSHEMTPEEIILFAAQRGAFNKG